MMCPMVYEYAVEAASHLLHRHWHCICGCSRSSQESQVSGIVTLDGKSDRSGTVVFGSAEAAGQPLDRSRATAAICS